MLPTKNPKKEIRQYSTAYWAQRPFWDDVLNLKEPLPVGAGDPGISRYLNQYPKEDKAEFATRIQRLAQVNFVDLIVESYISMLFSTNVQIKATKYQKQVDSFVECCNMQGDTLLEFFSECVAPSALSFGVVDVFVDIPRAEQEVQSLEQFQAAGLDAPYCYIVPPLNRVYWTLDDAGQYVNYQSIDVIDSQINAGMNIRDKDQYTFWTPDTMYVFNNNGGIIDQKDNPYGIVPAVTVIPRYSMRYHKDRLGLSLVQDVVPMQKRVINLLSLIYDWMENANFVTRVLIQDTEDGNEPPTESELAEGGNQRGLILRGKGSKLELVTPDAAGVAAMCAHLAETIERIYQSVSMPSDSNTNKTHQTGQTIRSNQAILFNRLSKITKHFEKALKRIVEMALRVQGIKDPSEAGVTVQWDRNFSYEAYITALQQLQMMKAVMSDITPTAVAEYCKAVVSPVLYDTGKMKQIDAEAEKWAKDQTAEPEPDDDQQDQNVSVEGINQQVTATNKAAVIEQAG